MSEASSPAMTVVVPTRDRPDRLARCLAALATSVRDDDEIFVVDSASTGTATVEVALAAGVGVHREVLPGASRARNVGWRRARHELVAFVDDDVVVRPDWAARLADAATGRSFVAGRVVPPPDQRHRGHPVAVVDRGAAGSIDLGTLGVLGASANLAVWRHALEAVDGFDERLGPGAAVPAAEDVDLLDRLLHAGYRGWFEPSAEAWHDQWRGHAERLRLDLGYGVGQGVRLRREWRRDRARARRLVVDTVVRSDLGGLRRSLADRYWFGAAAAVLRLLGVVRGAIGHRRP